jgi:hypothetical protein
MMPVPPPRWQQGHSPDDFCQRFACGGYEQVVVLDEARQPDMTPDLQDFTWARSARWQSRFAFPLSPVQLFCAFAWVTHAASSVLQSARQFFLAAAFALLALVTVIRNAMALSRQKILLIDSSS